MPPPAPHIRTPPSSTLTERIASVRFDDNDDDCGRYDADGEALAEMGVAGKPSALEVAIGIRARGSSAKGELTDWEKRRVFSLTEDKEREAVRAIGEARTAEGKTWNSDVQYVLAAIGSAIGLGNFLRFPSLAYRYGGAAFLIPYVLAIVLVGIPVMGLECTFGQMMQLSSVPAFGRIRPYLWGLGAFTTFASVSFFAPAQPRFGIAEHS